MRLMIRAAVAVLAILSAANSVAAASWTASMSGTVVDIKSLQPVPDAHVKIFTQTGSQPEGVATTDAHGAFVVTGLRGGLYRLQFEKSGYQSTIVSGISIRPGERMIEAAPIAMYPNGVRLPNFSMSKPCGALVQPGVTADVYVVCSE